MNDELRLYYRQVKALLPCSAREKKRCLMELRGDVDAFFDAAPDASMEDLYTAVGSPQTIAASFMERLTPRQYSTKRRLTILLSISAVVVIVLFGYILYSIRNDIIDLHDGYYIDSIQEITSAVEPPTPLTEN